ncbi:MAG TPA: M23 family metallopeptidase [Bacteroidales bacterium]|nr:M23 family metallopeptidase [Bacteroidales bacterium]
MREKLTSAVIYLFGLLNFINPVLSGQEKNTEFISPVNIPLYLSGNFGELRSNHFHSGIDIKTRGVEGQPVRAVEDGYISRIKVETGGYGHAVYITHPDGLMSVYGHLKSFRKDISDYVKEAEYKEQNFTVDLFPERGKFTLKQGEVFAYSGNTGSSAGPHLHFELRRVIDQHPLNVLKYGFDITDNIKPVIYNLNVYPLDEFSTVNGSNNTLRIKISGNNGRYTPDVKHIVVHGKTGFGIETYDYLNGTHNRCGIYSIEMQVDNTTIYLQKMDEISFAETRYVQSHIDYAENLRLHRKIQKTFIDPNNRLDIYKTLKNRGILTFDDSLNHPVKFIVKDTYGNTSELNFTVNSSIEAPEEPVTEGEPFTKKMDWDTKNDFETPNVKVSIPAGSLYRDLYFEYGVLPPGRDCISHIYEIHNEYTPLQKYITLSVMPDTLPYRLEGKALLVTFDDQGNPVPEGGNYDNGFITTQTLDFGKYAVMIDTVPPSIDPVNIYDHADMSHHHHISFHIDDNLSGIKKYEGYIDDQWVLFEYEPKFRLIDYKFDPKRLEKGKKHLLELYVTDEKDNISVYQANFTW